MTDVDLNRIETTAEGPTAVDEVSALLDGYDKTRVAAIRIEMAVVNTPPDRRTVPTGVLSEREPRVPTQYGERDTPSTPDPNESNVEKRLADHLRDIADRLDGGELTPDEARRQLTAYTPDEAPGGDGEREPHDNPNEYESHQDTTDDGESDGGGSDWGYADLADENIDAVTVGETEWRRQENPLPMKFRDRYSKIAKSLRVIKEDGPVDAGTIDDRVDENTSVSPALTRLFKTGYVERRPATEQHPHGLDRYEYRITDSGREELDRLNQEGDL